MIHDSGTDWYRTLATNPTNPAILVVLTKGDNEKPFVYDQHGGDDVTCKPRILVNSSQSFSRPFLRNQFLTKALLFPLKSSKVATGYVRMCEEDRKGKNTKEVCTRLLICLVHHLL